MYFQAKILTYDIEPMCLTTVKQLEYTDFYKTGKFLTKVMTTVLSPNLYFTSEGQVHLFMGCPLYTSNP